jgi:hypothetical protein
VLFCETAEYADDGRMQLLRGGHRSGWRGAQRFRSAFSWGCSGGRCWGRAGQGETEWEVIGSVGEVGRRVRRGVVREWQRQRVALVCADLCVG